MNSFRDILLNADRQQCRLMVKLLENLSKDEFRKTAVSALLDKHPGAGATSLDLKHLNDGWFDIVSLILIYDNFYNLSKGDPNSSALWVALLERLDYHGAVIKVWYSQHGPKYHVQNRMFVALRKAGITDFVTFGTSYLLEATRVSIPAINVKTQSGDEHCGTGALVPIGSQFMLLTNRHVVEGNQILNIKSKSETYIVTGPAVLCDFADLALIPVNPPSKTPVLSMAIDPHILTSVITVGYPLIATVSDQYALAHKGEVNGTVVDTRGSSFLTISNHVSPGNSGGPVLNDKGQIVGVVTQSGVGEFGSKDAPTGTYLSTYHMAIPPSIISKFAKKVESKVNISL